MPDQKNSSHSRASDLVATRDRFAELDDQLRSAEMILRQTRIREAHFRILSELVTDCCWIRWRSLDSSEERGWINDAFTELTGYTPKEFAQIGREGLVHPDDLDRVLAKIDGPIGVSQHDFRIIRKDGEVRWLHERVLVREDDNGLTVFGATRDITDERNAQQVVEGERRELERRVEERTAELLKLNSQLKQQSRERLRVAEELHTAKEAAEASNRAKSRFLANMTHELRTPLHAIVGLADLLLASELSPQGRQWVHILAESARSLQEMVQDVLDFSKVEADQVVLESHPVSLRDLIQHLFAVVRAHALASDIQLEFQIADTVPDRVKTDPTRLRQILLNLLDNAVKFTDHGVVRIAVEAQPRSEEDGGVVFRTRFRVQDTGIGFDEETKRRILDPFTQADSSTTRRYGGTGLGLTITRRLVELMGGELEIESKPGHGSTFAFTLDLPSPADDHEEEVRQEPIRGDDRRILVAEDNPVNQLVIREQLQSLGFAVEVVTDGEQALRRLSESRFDAWLVDCHMPVLDGYEAVRRWRRIEREQPRIPIIAVTATALRKELEACLEAGMDDWLTKPYQIDDLSAMLRRWLDDGSSTRRFSAPDRGI